MPRLNGTSCTRREGRWVLLLLFTVPIRELLRNSESLTSQQHRDLAKMALGSDGFIHGLFLHFSISYMLSVVLC